MQQRQQRVGDGHGWAILLGLLASVRIKSDAATFHVNLSGAKVQHGVRSRQCVDADHIEHEEAGRADRLGQQEGHVLHLQETVPLAPCSGSRSTSMTKGTVANSPSFQAKHNAARPTDSTRLT